MLGSSKGLAPLNISSWPGLRMMSDPCLVLGERLGNLILIGLFVPPGLSETKCLALAVNSAFVS